VVLAPELEQALQQRLEREPLVEPHAVDDDEDHAAPLLEVRDDGLAHHVGGERGPRGAPVYPPRVMLLDEAPELDVEPAAEVAVRLLEAVVAHLVEPHVPARHLDRAVDPPSLSSARRSSA